jgi:hypothetical protein
MAPNFVVAVCCFVFGFACGRLWQPSEEVQMPDDDMDDDYDDEEDDEDTDDVA